MIEYFISVDYGNYCGFGFDKLEEEDIEEGGYLEVISEWIYGYIGFMGICVWVDLDEELIFIFLFNWIYLDCNNCKFFKDKVRECIYNVIYDVLDIFELEWLVMEW